MFGLPIPVLLVACVACGLWARWLWLKTSAPRWICAVSVVLSLSIAIASVLASHGLLSSFSALSGEGESSQRAHALARGVALMMESLAYGSITAVVNVGLLIVLSWRYRGSAPPDTAAEG